MRDLRSNFLLRVFLLVATPLPPPVMDFRKSTSFGGRKCLTILAQIKTRVQDLILINKCIVYIISNDETVTNYFTFNINFQP